MCSYLIVCNNVAYLNTDVLYACDDGISPLQSYQPSASPSRVLRLTYLHCIVHDGILARRRPIDRLNFGRGRSRILSCSSVARPIS